MRQLQNRLSHISLKRSIQTYYMIEHNGSVSGVVAKWFSDALFDIGIPEAIEALKAFSVHWDTEVREEVAYR